MKLEFTFSALRDLGRLPKAIARRIMDKMEWFAQQDDPLSFAKPLKNSNVGSYRFRIGAYRILVDIHKNHISVLIVLAVRHRKDVYRS